MAIFLLSGLAIAALARPGSSPARPREASSIASADWSLPAGIGKGIASHLSATPFFASYRGLRLRLPVPAPAVTAVAFHQASYDHSVVLTPLVPLLDAATAERIAASKRARLKAKKTGPPSASASASVSSSTAVQRAAKATSSTAAASSAASSSAPPDIWGGKAVRLWRTGRRGLPDTAVDVGALPGTPVFAPVDGKVVFVQRYKLYSRYPDFEIHIMPKDVSGVDVVLLHVDRVRVSAGDMVSAGITQIAVVRDLSMLSDIQLAEYTPGRGDHTHVQINRVPAPGSIWITGGKGPVIKRLPSPSTESSAAVH